MGDQIAVGARLAFGLKRVVSAEMLCADSPVAPSIVVTMKIVAVFI
jgi:hypothetical protein